MKLRITLEGTRYDVDVEVLPEPVEEVAEPAGAIQIPQPPARPDTRPEDKICRSPIAGVVVAITAVLKQRLRQDDPVVVIEAMKMQTSIGAPVDGVVEEVHVTPGETVKPGQILCTLS